MVLLPKKHRKKRENKMENTVRKRAVIYVRSSGPKEVLLYQLQNWERELYKNG